MAYVYLASPYTDKSELIVERRYQQVLEVTAQMLAKKIHVYSPIVHCHVVAKRHKLPKDFNFWREYNEAMLIGAGLLYILELEGWEKSLGLKGETAFAVAHGIQIMRLPYPNV